MLLSFPLGSRRAHGDSRRNLWPSLYFSTHTTPHGTKHTPPSAPYGTSSTRSTNPENFQCWISYKRIMSKIAKSRTLKRLSELKAVLSNQRAGF